MKNLNSLFILCLLSIFVSSCIPTTYTASTQNLDELPYTVEPKKISSHTPLPLVSTTTSSATATLTPLPTLTTQEAEQIIAKMMNDNGNCKEPCFWGITLERTDIWDTVRWLDSLTRSFGYKGIAKNTKGSKINYNTSFTLKKDLDILINLWVEDARISSIETRFFGLSSPNIENKDWQAFRPEEIMKKFGEPDQITYDLATGAEGYGFYTIALIYPQFIIDYQSNLYQWHKSSCICPFAEKNIDSFNYLLGVEGVNMKQYGRNIEDITKYSKHEISLLMKTHFQEFCFDIDYKAYYEEYPDALPPGFPATCGE